MAEFFGLPIRQDPCLAIGSEEATAAFQVLVPKQSPFPLIRLGGNHDGGYLIPNDLEGISRCLSPGVNNFKDFEDELVIKHGIRCDLVDASSDLTQFSTGLIEGMQTFYQKWLDINGETTSISIADWISMQSEDEQDFIMQMDIEGAEYRNLLSLDDQSLKRFRIITLELHRVATMFTRPNIFHQVLQPLLSKLDSHFICVHAHPNNALGYHFPPPLGFAVPRLLEITLLRRDRFPPKSSLSQPQVSLPHPLDRTNDLRRAPYHLDAPWSQQKLSLAARLRRLKDWTEFFSHHKNPRLVTAYAKLWINDLF